MFQSLGFWTKIAFFFLLRSGRSTAVLSLMVIAAVAALIFLSALAVGINDAMVRNSASLYSGHISGVGLPLVLDNGKSGSGKTTLLNFLRELERPGKGRVSCFGAAIHSLSETALCRFQRQHVGFVFQYGSLLSCLTVFDNIAFPLTLNGIDGRKKEQRVQELLERIGLPGTGAALPYELSGGEVQRVAVARALAHSPRMLLANEPTASLDSSKGQNLIKLMFDLGKEQACTLVVSTRDPELIELTDDSLYLKDGKIIREDS